MFLPLVVFQVHFKSRRIKYTTSPLFKFIVYVGAPAAITSASSLPRLGKVTQELGSSNEINIGLTPSQSLHDLFLIIMPPLSVPYSSRNLLERHAESFREDLLASNNPSCVVCRRPGDATWAPSPLSHTFFCRLPELARASHSCRRCCIILQGVSHFAHMFNPGYQEDDVLIRYDEDDRDHAHVLQMKRSRTARVSVGLGEQIGMVPINLRISLTSTCKLLDHEKF